MGFLVGTGPDNVTPSSRWAGGFRKIATNMWEVEGEEGEGTGRKGREAASPERGQIPGA